LAFSLEGGEMPALATLSVDKLSAIIEGRSPVPQDAAVRAAAAIFPAYVTDRDTTKALLSERDQLLAKLLELQEKNSEETFYPDANGCLRLSAGHVEGYTAADAVTHTAVTSLAGLIDKHIEASLTKAKGASGGGLLGSDTDFDAPSRLVELCGADASILATPVCICYSTDTVGGNSGSPVLDANGDFVAINFDRQRLGLMNEFKWSHDYSRSIGTDVRYILFLVGKYDGAQWLVDEMVPHPN